MQNIHLYLACLSILHKPAVDTAHFTNLIKHEKYFMTEELRVKSDAVTGPVWPRGWVEV